MARHPGRSRRPGPARRLPTPRSTAAPAPETGAATLDVREAAALLRLHPKRVQVLARAGKLPAARIGRKWLFRRDALERLLRAETADVPGGGELEISARNRLRGRITRLDVDGLMAELHLDIGGQTIVAVITRSSAERLGLRVGGEAFALIKATEVLVGRVVGS